MKSKSNHLRGCLPAPLAAPMAAGTESEATRSTAARGRGCAAERQANQGGLGRISQPLHGKEGVTSSSLVPGFIDFGMLAARPRRSIGRFSARRCDQAVRRSLLGRSCSRCPMSVRTATSSVPKTAAARSSFELPARYQRHLRASQGPASRLQRHRLVRRHRRRGNLPQCPDDRRDPSRHRERAAPRPRTRRRPWTAGSLS